MTNWSAFDHLFSFVFYCWAIPILSELLKNIYSEFEINSCLQYPLPQLTAFEVALLVHPAYYTTFISMVICQLQILRKD